MAKENLHFHVTEKGEATFDVDSGDAGCKDATQKILTKVRDSGLEIDILNQIERYQDDDDGKIKVKC